MKIIVDDWRFRGFENHMLTLDLFLENGQHAFLEIIPLINPEQPGRAVPEMIVFAEIPGEKLDAEELKPRWVSRPPRRDCAWSQVEIPPALEQQIHEHLNQPPAAAPAAS